MTLVALFLACASENGVSFGIVSLAFLCDTAIIVTMILKAYP